MKDPLLVRETQHFCNLSDQVKSIIDSEPVLIDFKVMIEANQRGVMFKDQCRSQLMLCEPLKP